jgi:hypothetical protein
VGERRTVRTSVVIGVCALAVSVAAAIGIASSRSADDVPAHGFSVAGFLDVRSGMIPSRVRELLGRPSRTTESLAEGFAWPEPADACWYYARVDATREYQVCFIGGRVRTHGSYPIVPRGDP